jgi:hypothetical protein
MGLLNLVIVLAGVALMAVGWVRARGPWSRYQALKQQESNLARYESWRGGVRDTGPTGASVAMAMFRRQARDGALVMLAGFALVVLGLVWG